MAGGRECLQGAGGPGLGGRLISQRVERLRTGRRQFLRTLAASPALRRALPEDSHALGKEPSVRAAPPRISSGLRRRR